jgi:hypothetical protein
MNWKNFFITFVVIYILGGILNFLIHGVLLAETYQALSAVWRPEMDSLMWVQAVTALFLSFFFIYIFAKGREGFSSRACLLKFSQGTCCKSKAPMVPEKPRC